ncbi:OmpP1/FadL family transporter [Methylophaga sp. OBS3]|uniref:OmpP1/FadL family transporter n=1 Tax=Methylophaga sp. OBS3 TaxID=2991934 RepID=UPI00224EA70F|nr:outer membrane protein transport protein [Methylophaga sp. OBS3]MCX4188947.1 OmpP1/FadL family transporter [Methylophaga sp. OBS3]
MSLSRLSLLILLGAGSSSAYAAGYAILEQSITGLGRAFSGSAAVADDASTIFFNPAGLTQLDRSEVIFGANFIAPYAKFDKDSATLPSGLGDITGGDNGNATESAIVPNFYYAHPVNDRLVLGIGVGAPFGLVTDYSDDWVGRYHARRSDLKTININPSFGFKATDKLSVGAGINLQYADIELSQAVDFGTACLRAAVGPCAQPQNFDGQAKVTADDWSWGYNLGVTYQFTEATRAGLSYRSKITHDLEGKGEFRIPNDPTVQAVANGGGFQNGKAEGRVTLPESVSLALHHQINSQWVVMADATWTRWSRFEELRIESDVERLNSQKDQDWENTMRYGLGVEYTPNDRWSWRAGIAYDETPVPSAQRRTPRIADNDRKWVAFGASYAYSDNLMIDAAYAHLFMSDSKVDEVNEQGYRLQGEFRTHVDIVGVQVRWLFD